MPAIELILNSDAQFTRKLDFQYVNGNLSNVKGQTVSARETCK